jgi:hypothetical protein
MPAYDGAGLDERPRASASPAGCYQEEHRARQEDKFVGISSGRLKTAQAATQNCCSVAIEYPPLMCGVIDNSSTDASTRSTR